MKRFWIGVGILCFLLLGGILLTAVAAGIHQPVSNCLELAVEAAQTAAFADHEPMEQIDSGFAQTYAFLRCRDVNEFSAACGALASLVRAMADSQAITWWNFL